MSRAAFDIMIPEQPDDNLRQSTLLMEVGENYFRYIIYDKSQKVLLGLRQYQFEKTAEKSVAEFLQDIIAEDPHLRHPLRESVVIYNYTDSSLLPEKHFHVEISKPVTELVYGNAHKGLVLSEKIQGWNIYNIYRIPREIHTLMQQKFSAGKYWHFYTIWLSSINKDDLVGNRLFAIFYPDKFLALAFKNDQLYLLQSYSYQTPEDVVYYLLSVCQQLKERPDTVKLVLSGLIDEESSLYREIFKYFLHTDCDKQPETINSQDLLNEFPSHYFSPLLKLALCV